MSRRQTVISTRSIRKTVHAPSERQTRYETRIDDIDDRYSDYEGSENEFEFPEGFDETRARQKLLQFKNCTQIVLSPEQQLEMGLEIGVNVTAEHPWKQVTTEVLVDYLSAETPEAEEFKKKLKLFDKDELVLVGYAAALSEEEDTFLFFETARAAKEASILIAQVEAAERRKARRAQVKHPRKWKSLGSEVEVDKMAPVKGVEPVEVEIQSVYPVGHSYKPFQLRRTCDARDGYVELVPKKGLEFANVYRKRVDMYMQSARPRVHIEQQTDPTFPTNAWSQYLYEIGQDKAEEPVAQDDDEEPVRRKRGARSEPVMPVIPSERVDELLESLDFNSVNMYRNDYNYICEKNVARCKVPFLKEEFCFVNMDKTLGRVVASIDWHPVYSGLAVVSYTFSTSSTTVPINDETDTIKRCVLEPNPVIMWSFDDTLHPKLELAAIREITCISYCPYDENLVVGGTINGQLLVWDMTDRLRKVETKEILTAAQARYRLAMRMFLDWTKQDEADRIVRPVALSAMQGSHRAAVTSIQWLSRECYMAVTGTVKVNKSGGYRYIATSSQDCTIAFWDMDFFDEVEAKRPRATPKLKLPAHLIDKPSEYERLNNLFRPQVVLEYTHPVNCMMLDRGEFMYSIQVGDNDCVEGPRTQTTRVEHQIIQKPMEVFADRIVAGTMNGNVINIKWEGSDTTTDSIKKEKIKMIDTYAQIHDGSIEAIDRNPFCPDLFLTIGRNILALWRDGVFWTPVFWRSCPDKMTEVKWSKNRPAVFFLTRGDGSFEAWDLMSRTDAPCFVESLGGEVLTKVSQHKLTLPEEVVAIGDFNSSLRIMNLPSTFTKPLNNEIYMLDNFIDREMARKEFINKWQITFYESSADMREARRQAGIAAQLEAERLEKEFREEEDMRLRKEEAEERRAYAKAHNKAVFDMPEQMERKWDEANIKRLMGILMSMKQVDPELLAKWTKPEKERLAFCEQKRLAIEESFSLVARDMAKLRAKLIPPDVVDEGRVVIVKEQLKLMMDDAERETEVFEDNRLEILGESKSRSDLDYAGILLRGRQRREVINKSLGSNTQHRHTFYGGTVGSAASVVPEPSASGSAEGDIITEEPNK